MINSYDKNRKQLLLLEEHNLLTEELIQIQDRINMLPNGLVRTSFKLSKFGIHGMYEVTNDFNSDNLMYNKSMIKQLVREYNRTLLKQHLVTMKLTKLSPKEYVVMGGSYAQGSKKIKSYKNI